MNLINYIDRGIIPGSVEEFSTFISKNMDTDTPSLYIGLLQSSFIIGLCIASPIFAYLAHAKGSFLLVGIGVGIWLLAAVWSGFSYYTNNYYLLLFGRIFSGAGEAGFICCCPPWIALNADPKSKSTWLAIFYTAIPVGTALGYVYSSIITNAIGWQWAFFIEAAYMFPFLCCLIPLHKRFPLLEPGQNHFQNDSEEPLLVMSEAEDQEGQITTNSDIQSIEIVQNEYINETPSLWEEIKIVMSSRCFVYMCLGYAAETAVLIGLSTFGSSFFMSLGYFDEEVDSSSAFGVIVSLAGMYFYL
jgi:MFS family permease